MVAHVLLTRRGNASEASQKGQAVGVAGASMLDWVGGSEGAAWKLQRPGSVRLAHRDEHGRHMS